MKFYFDMDGVITNFDSMVPNSAMLNHPSETLSDVERAAKKQFWLNVEQNHNFWCDMPMIQNADYMLSVAYECGEIFVLSKTPGAKHFLAGQEYVNFVASEKRKWIQKHLKQFFDEQHVIICDGNKGKLIQPTHNDILIDDRIENINDWTTCGGRGILHKSPNDTVEKIKMHDFISYTK